MVFWWGFSIFLEAVQGWIAPADALSLKGFGHLWCSFLGSLIFLEAFGWAIQCSWMYVYLVHFFSVSHFPFVYGCIHHGHFFWVIVSQYGGAPEGL